MRDEGDAAIQSGFDSPVIPCRPSAPGDETRPRRPDITSPVFHVVTPCLNIARFIGETIESVVSQSGDFTIRYHIQDGGSRDGTLEIARQWQERIRTGAFAPRCRGVHVTIESCPDRGMYEAIHTGFHRLAPAPLDLMTWINGDDLLAAGALSAVAAAFRDLPQVQLVGGRNALVDARGEECGGGASIAYSRSCIAAGLYDGRHLPFIQQEGTFWRAHLWERAGGIDPTFRLAGDFDLWRRFAAMTEYVTLDTVIGLHRQHPGQLSADLAAYYREIDERKAGWTRQFRETLRDYRAWLDRGHTEDRFAACIARCDARTGRWTLVDSPPWELLRRVLHPFDGDWAVVSGVDDPEGPFPDLGLHRQVQWIVGRPATLTVFSARRGPRTLALTVRGMMPGQRLELRVDDKALGVWRLRGRFPEVERLTVEHRFGRGPCQVELRMDQWTRTARGRQLGVILDGLEFESPVPSRASRMRALGSSWKRPWPSPLPGRLREAQGRAAGYLFASIRRSVERRARAFRIVGPAVMRQPREEGDLP